MNRREFLNKTGQTGLGLILGSSLISQSIAATKSGNKKPNIVLIVIDDWGYADAGFLGSDLYCTPYIDKLRREGMFFTDNYCAGAVCTPSRLGIVTGKYPARYDMNAVYFPRKPRMQRLIEPPINPNLPVEVPTIADVLTKAGYATAHVGKWHLGEKGHRPEDQGFEFVSKELTHKESPIPNDYKNIKYYNQQSLKFIKDNKDKPFFLYLPHDAMHHDYEADPELIKKYQAKIKPGMTHSNATYAATLEHLDEGIGELIRGIDEMGLKDNTVIFLLSEGGGRNAKVDHQIATDNTPLKHGKHTLYEGGIRVPLIARWPGKVKKNSTCSVPVHGIDFFPTITEITNTPKDYYDFVDGVSILNLLKGTGDIPQRSLYWYYPHYIYANFWWTAQTYSMQVRPCAAIRDDEYKLIHWFEDDVFTELYNVKEDISEKTNLARLMPGKVKELRTKLENWFEKVNATLPKPNPDWDPSYDEVPR